MNLRYLQARAGLSALKLLPAATRDAAIRERIAMTERDFDIGLGPILGLVGDALPDDSGVQAAWHTFKHEIWRWWTAGGGK